MQNKYKIILNILFFSLIACNSKKNNSKISLSVLTDDLNREVKIDKYPQKIISLVPSITEIIYAISADKQLIAISEACNFPVRSKSKIKISTYPEIKYEIIYSLKPDLVLVSDELFSVNIIENFEKLKIPLFFQNYRSVDNILKGILKLGNITGHSKEANHLVDSLKVRIKLMKSQSKTFSRNKILVLVGTNPIKVAGRNSYINNLLEIAGGINAMEENLNIVYPIISREYALKIQPDIIIGVDIKEIESVFFEEFPELKQVPAYRNKKVFRINAELIYRPSNRFIEAVEEIKKIIDNYTTD